MLKLKLQYFGHLMWRGDLLGKTLMLGKTEGKRRRHWQRMRWLDSISGSTGMTLRKFGEVVEDREAWHATFHEATVAWARLESSNQKGPAELGFESPLPGSSPLERMPAPFLSGWYFRLTSVLKTQTLSLCALPLTVLSLTINSGPLSAVSACLKQEPGNFSSNLEPLVF